MDILNKIKHGQLIPIWGDREQIKLIQKYERLRTGVDPVEQVSEWVCMNENDEENYPCYKIWIICPNCFGRHKVVVEFRGTGHEYYYNDSNYCVSCAQEFGFKSANANDVFTIDNDL